MNKSYKILVNTLAPSIFANEELSKLDNLEYT